MAISKPTITHCLDGKDHNWLIVVEEKDANGAQWEHRWCQKCGALTQVIYDGNGQPIAVMADGNKHFLMLPKVLAMVIK